MLTPNDRTGGIAVIPPGAHQVSTVHSSPEMKLALSHIKALCSGFRRLNGAQGKNHLPRALETIVSDAHSLRDLCNTNRWHVPATVTLIFAKLVTCLRDDPSRINVSTTRTAAKALDFLRTVITTGSQSLLEKRLPLRVMIIDDDAVSRRAMLMALNAADVTVTNCCCGEEAIEKLREGDFDVLFSDIMMPRISGFDLLTLVRDMPRHRQTPVVFVTALSDFQTRARSIVSGGCDFVGKPIFPAEILLKAFTFGFGPLLPKEGVSESSEEAESEATVPQPEPNAQTSAATKSLETKAPGIIKVDQRGCIDCVNKEAQVLLAESAANPVGIHITELFPERLQSPEGGRLLTALSEKQDGQKIGPVVLCSRRTDGKIAAISAILSQTSHKGVVSSVLLVSAAKPDAASAKPDVSVSAAKPDVNEPSTQPTPTPALKMETSQNVPVDSQKTETLLREELAATRALAAALENGQEALEEKLESANNEIQGLNQQLQHLNAQLAEANHTCANLERKLGAAERELHAKVSTPEPPMQRAISPANGNGQTHFMQPEPGLNAPIARSNGNGSHMSHAVAAKQDPSPAFSGDPGSLAAELKACQARLQKQKREAQNQRLIQEMLCDRLRSLDPDFSAE